jgi:hypothetical protein
MMESAGFENVECTRARLIARSEVASSSNPQYWNLGALLLDNMVPLAGRLALSEKYETVDSIKALFEQCIEEFEKEDTWLDVVTCVGQKPSN